MKRRIFDWYKEFLQNNSNLRLLEEKKGSYSNYKPIKLPKFKKPLIICGPLKNNIEISKIVKLSKKKIMKY